MKPLFLVSLICVAASAIPVKSPRLIFRENPELTVEELRRDVQNRRFAANGTESMLPTHKFGIFSWSLLIGTPKSYFTVVVDTASVETFVADVGFISGPARGQRYNASASSTSQLFDRKYEIEKGGIEVSGDTYEDVVEFDDIKIKHRFGSINWIYGEDEMFVDGQLGLAWRPYENQRAAVATPIIHSLLEKKKNIFQVYWKPRVMGIMMGDTGLCRDSKLIYIPLLKQKPIPMIPVHAFELDNFHYAVEHPGVVDSSYGSVFLPNGPFRAVIASYDFRFNQELGVFLGKCDGAHKWEFTIGGKKDKFKVTDAEILMDIDDPEGRCAVLLGWNPHQEPTYTFGTPFISKYCLSFDVGNNAIGLAENE